MQYTVHSTPYSIHDLDFEPNPSPDSPFVGMEESNLRSAQNGRLLFEKMISFVALGDTSDASNGPSNEAIDAIETAEVNRLHHDLFRIARLE